MFIPLLPLLVLMVFCHWLKLSAVGGAVDRKKKKRKKKKKLSKEPKKIKRPIAGAEFQPQYKV